MYTMALFIYTACYEGALIFLMTALHSTDNLEVFCKVRISHLKYFGYNEHVYTTRHMYTMTLMGRETSNYHNFAQERSTELNNHLKMFRRIEL